jgi:tRNA 2-thiocytidine biosynthesis protein TtcA
MPPKLRSDDGRHVVIRPLAYVEEKDLEAYAEARAFPIIPCDLCGSQEQLQRKQVKAMLREWERRHPGRLETIFNSLTRVAPSHLLDRALFDFMSLATGDETVPDSPASTPIRLLK